MSIKYSKHAREQMVARGITEKQVAIALKSGSKHLQFPDKIIAEYTYFSVVYKKIDECIFIITVKPRW
ncbi:DUF4258 domain-containing protein [Candidatus Woesearchaeota archaeon]|nr:DUF4258 domain-containing protein [Candidatus Woesearchaeota archaeon]